MIQPETIICISLLSCLLSDPPQDIHHAADSYILMVDGPSAVQVHAACGLLVCMPISQTASNSEFCQIIALVDQSRACLDAVISFCSKRHVSSCTDKKGLQSGCINTAGTASTN